MGNETRIPLNHRPTIGLFIWNTMSENEYDVAVWHEVIKTTEERDVNLICFPGGTISPDSADVHTRQRHLLYSLANTQRLDGLIVSDTISNTVALDEIVSFYRHYPSLPIVSIGRVLDKFISVIVDNYGGMHDAMIHILQTHDCRQIAFIKGPEHSEGARQRHQAYQDALAEYGLSYNPELVVDGDFSEEAGRAAVRTLVETRNAEPDAIVAANDAMALGAIAELERLGLRVPYDVLMVGFDDTLAARAMTPPLTTVRQPVRRMARQATQALLSLLAGEEVSPKIIVPTHLQVRQSCGCLSPAVAQAATEFLPGMETESPYDFATVLQRQKETILFEMAQAVDPTASPDINIHTEQLLSAFSQAIAKDTPATFMTTLEEILRHMSSEQAIAWHGAISALRHQVLSILLNQKQSSEIRHQAENLWHQAHILIGEVAQRRQLAQHLQSVQQRYIWQTISMNMVTTFDMETLKNVVIEALPRLHIPACSVALYEGYGTPPAEARLLTAYNRQGPIEVPHSASDEQNIPDALLFPSAQLIPAFLEPNQEAERYNWLLEPLHFQNDPLGFVLFEVGTLDGSVYPTMAGFLSSAIKGALLVEEVKERTRALQEANYALQRRAIYLETSAQVTHTIASIFDLDELFHQAVNLIRDRFGFYHAGIFLLDESGKWAVLKEATGEAGAQMKAQGHRLAVGETSMVGWTAFHQEPRIALYAKEDAIRFANPLLPYTRSEMTLPMMVGGRLLGVLNVQSTEEAAFDGDDVRALQSLANQIAIAIENARRVSDEARLLELSSPIYRVSRRLAQATTTDEVAEAIIASIRETGADGCTVVEFEFSPQGEPIALLYRGVWRKDRETQFQPGLRLPINESPFPIDMVSTLWTVTDVLQGHEENELPESARQVFINTGVRALANIPLQVRKRVIGQVVVLRDTPGIFPENAMRLYRALSDQAAVALERAQLWEQAQERAHYEQQTRQMIDHIRRAMDIEDALQTAVTELTAAFEVPHVAIELEVMD